MKKLNKVAVGVFLLGQTLSGAAFAAAVTLNGTNVDYTFDDALLGLFGEPTLVGDTLSFAPSSAFEVESLNGEGIAMTNDTLNIQMTAHSGFYFDDLNVMERGSYMLLGAGSNADVVGQARVHALSDPTVEVISNFNSDAPMDQTGRMFQNWTAESSTDLSSFEGAGTLHVTLQNMLVAETTAASSMAFADKKYASLNPTVVPIPEAQVSAMMLAGLGLIGWQIGRRRNAFK